MQFVNLNERSDKLQDYIKLVEDSFGYHAPHSYQVDFYPLVNFANHQNCYMFIDENKVIATCAYQERIIGSKKIHKVVLLGAIAVHTSYRGKGVGRKLVERVITKMPEVCWLGLWSDKKSFFNSLNFFDYGEQYFLPVGYLKNNILKIKIKAFFISKLDTSQRVAWMGFYQELAKKRVTMVREELDWKNIFNIYSAKYLEIYFEDKQIGFAVLGKGMDLQNVVHEFFVEESFELAALEKLNQEHALWLPSQGYDWDKQYLGSNLMIRKHSAELWDNWSSDIRGDFLISGLDSV